MKIKTYSNGSVTYSYSLNSKKWEFNIPAIQATFLTPVPGRSQMAAKIANVLAGSAKRSNSIDGLARANISKILG